MSESYVSLFDALVGGGGEGGGEGGKAPSSDFGVEIFFD